MPTRQSKDDYEPTPNTKALDVLYEILRMREVPLSKIGEEDLESVRGYLMITDPPSCGFLIMRNSHIECWTPWDVQQPHVTMEFLFKKAGEWQIHRPLALYFLWDGQKWWETTRAGFVTYLYYTMRETPPSPFMP